MKTLNDYIRVIPDFPKKGVVFRDITTILESAEGFKLAIDSLQDIAKDLDFDVVMGAEARGFLFAAPIAYNLEKSLVLIRKKGKLPFRTVSVDYTLEYGSVNTLEIHEDSIRPGQKVLLIDDILATGGTMEATAHLVENCGGIVAGIIVLVELAGLRGRELLKNYPLYAVLTYEGN